MTDFVQKLSKPFFLPTGAVGSGFMVTEVVRQTNPSGGVDVVAYGYVGDGVRAGMVVSPARMVELRRRATLAVTGTLHQTVRGQVNERGKIVTQELHSPE